MKRGFSCRSLGYSPKSISLALNECAVAGTCVHRLDCFAYAFNNNNNSHATTTTTSSSSSSSCSQDVLSAVSRGVSTLLDAFRLSISTITLEFQQQQQPQQSSGGQLNDASSYITIASVLHQTRALRRSILRLSKLIMCHSVTPPQNMVTTSASSSLSSTNTTTTTTFPELSQIKKSFEQFPRGAQLVSYLYEAASVEQAEGVDPIATALFCVALKAYLPLCSRFFALHDE
jgi:hypothetical protein